ncbi:hypothetical protein ASPWEDRAFT_489058 [Aspergillus wentii DTO 134E9]|uniref:Malate dehydrogenase n=1 Tax=Aspergillus wentii DTO 134E9 TaxID=1073089 RepID=A0A1L9RJE0_ASPWE|nr:uncharacterized protein ASPWEDRAFT_489058 [Aspergillus wentii DTO 134E9]KAI9932031.1 hypothetical protein MW887_009534 [Aspergillus wentii]OJJ35014.1 hypothetical protein ASPWEDRAFT_489058 [Aspergillus wentii DTO 134E9]
MRSILFIITCLAATSIAAPTLLNGLFNYSDDVAEFIGKVSKHIDNAKKSTGSSAVCDTSKIALPANASGLPSPSGQKPIYVGVGRGTQNYTCESATSDSSPVAVGAVASLYNVTCIAANYPDIANMLPNLAYKVPLTADISAALGHTDIDLLGHHFFTGSVPTFNLDTTPDHQYGIAFTKKDSSMNAPAGSVQGDNGAVAWLYLTATNGTVGDYESVYRVQTAGGSPPKTCENQPSTITVQYAANYYFYGKE